jgi:hypothetical protein
MSIASAAVLAKLRDELRVVTTRTVALASSSRFRRIVDDTRGLVAALAPTDLQRAEAAELHARLLRWGGVVGSLTRRYAIATPVPLEHLVQRAATYVLLQRTTPPDIPEGRWRHALEQEWSHTAFDLEQLLALCERAIPPSTPPARYERIDIRIDSTDEANCRVSVDSATDHVTAISPLPFTLAELAALVESCRRPRAVAAIEQIDPLKRFGRKLFSVITHGGLAHAYEQACRRAGERNARIWLQFHLSGAGVLARAPWELLHDGNDFLALQRSTAITRTFEHVVAPHCKRPGPLRVLVTISSPRDQRALGGARERQLLQDALGGLELLGQLELEFAPDGTLDTLRRMLRRAEETNRPYSAWHFIGHGRWHDVHGRAELAMTAVDGNSHFVGGYELQVLFGGHPALELAVLNACQSGLGGMDDVSSGVAPALMECGIPTVVAMQFQISDVAAVVLCEELYGAVAAGADFLGAVSEARRAIFCQPQGVEWMTPVVFLRRDPDTNTS